MSQWPRYLGIIAYSLNAVENSTTGVSPYFATFGANPRSTVAQLVGLTTKTVVIGEVRKKKMQTKSASDCYFEWIFELGKLLVNAKMLNSMR